MSNPEINCETCNTYILILTSEYEIYRVHKDIYYDSIFANLHRRVIEQKQIRMHNKLKQYYTSVKEFILHYVINHH